MVNRVTLTGHLGADPDVKELSAGVVANCRLATTDYYKDRATGNLKEATEWHRLVFFGRHAEIARDFLAKGSRIYIDGRLRTRKWTSNGQDRYTTEVVVEALEMIGAPRGHAQPEGNPDAGGPPHTGDDEWTRAYDEAEVSQAPSR
jgi:single-strand DNA-binding protein